jgi:hypothetical protein
LLSWRRRRLETMLVPSHWTIEWVLGSKMKLRRNFRRANERSWIWWNRSEQFNVLTCYQKGYNQKDSYVSSTSWCPQGWWWPS